jgi:hypothetical protein
VAAGGDCVRGPVEGVGGGGMTHDRLADQCAFKDLSLAVAHGCRRDFIEAWTSLDTALSGGLGITRTGFQTMRRER